MRRHGIERNRAGFTIVELLVVIVIIGILASLAMVSYIGISRMANEAAIQAELANASKKLAMYHSLYNTYPTKISTSTDTGCPTSPKSDRDLCIKYSIGTEVAYIPKSAETYDLFFSKNGLIYKISEGGQPISVTVTTPITAMAMISGTAQVSQTLTAGAISPTSATVSYQWQSAPSASGTYTNIPNATDNTYAVSPSYVGKYIKLTVKGIGEYTGTQVSSATAQIPTDSNWITIGNQTWAKSNLNIGTMINNTINPTNNSTVEKYCYGNIEANCTADGAFYQWDEAMNYSSIEGAQGICPAGSHVPSDNDWKILEVQLGMTQAQADSEGWRGTDQGTQLKSGGSSGMNIPLSGYRHADNTFNVQGTYSYLWTSSTAGANVWNRLFWATNNTVRRNTGINKTYGVSLRCQGNY